MKIPQAITHKILKDAGCCETIDQYFETKKSWSPSDLLEEVISRKQYPDAGQALSLLMNTRQRQEWAIFSAKSVLHIFEEQYPNDARPRKAIQAAEAYLKDPSAEAAHAAAYAARAAYTAAAHAAARAAAHAAHAAARTAAYAARTARTADAARAAARTVADAAVSAAYAAVSVAYAARAADAADAAADTAYNYPDLLRKGLEIYLGEMNT